MMRTRGGEQLILGKKPVGQRFVGFPSIASGAGKRQPSKGSVTGAPSSSVPFGNQALPGKPSRGLATNFGARGLAPRLPGSPIGTKTSYQPLTMPRPTPFLETRAPALESPAQQGYVRALRDAGSIAPAAPPVIAGNGTMNKLSKSTMRQTWRRIRNGRRTGGVMPTG